METIKIYEIKKYIKNYKIVPDMFDIKIFVHADSDERLIRRLKRDIAERGRNLDEVLSRYQNTLKPMHEQFIEPMKEYADLIIPNNKYNTVAIDVVKTILKILGKTEDLIEFVKDRLGHDFRYSLNSDRIHQEIGWKPKVQFSEGIEKTVKWYLDNVEWVRTKAENR